MTLADWLHHNGLTNREFGFMVGTTEACVQLWRAGLRRPSVRRRYRPDGGVIMVDYAQAVAIATNGAVTKADLDAAWQQRKKEQPLNGKLGPVRSRKKYPAASENSY